MIKISSPVKARNSLKQGSNKTVALLLFYANTYAVLLLTTLAVFY